jgi:hypothetical protein
MYIYKRSMSLNMSEIRNNPGGGYSSITVKLYEMEYMDHKIHIVMADDIAPYITMYLGDLSNDVYDTKYKLIHDYLSLKLSPDQLNQMMVDTNLQGAFDIFKKFEEFEEIISEWLIPRKVRMERNGKLESILEDN